MAAAPMTTTAMLDKTADHPEIWLEPKSDDYDREGRMWCQDNQWGTEGVRYVLAPLSHAAGDVAPVVDKLTAWAQPDTGAKDYGAQLVCAEAATTLTALSAENAGMKAERDKSDDERVEILRKGTAWRARAEAAEARVNELEAENAKLMHVATNRRYMLDAYRNMLGEKGLEVAAMWDANGVTRIHFDWGRDAAKMTGEERASFILAMETVPKTLVDDVDTARSLSPIKEAGNV